MKNLIFTVFFLFVMVGTASAYQEVSTVVSNNGVTGVVMCASVAKQIVPAQPGRFNFGMINNDSTKTVYWGYSSSVSDASGSASPGIPIYAKSGVFKDRTKRAFWCVTNGSDVVELRYFWE
jgi:hypothetical protein